MDGRKSTQSIDATVFRWEEADLTGVGSKGIDQMSVMHS